MHGTKRRHPSRCCLQITPFVLPNDTSRTPGARPVPVLILYRREIQILLWSQTETENNIKKDFELT